MNVQWIAQQQHLVFLHLIQCSNRFILLRKCTFQWNCHGAKRKIYVHSRSFYNLVDENNEIEWSDVWPHRRLKLNKLRLKKRANGQSIHLLCVCVCCKRKGEKKPLKKCVFFYWFDSCAIYRHSYTLSHVSECDPRAIIYNFLLPAQPDFSTSSLLNRLLLSTWPFFLSFFVFVYCNDCVLCIALTRRLVPRIVSSSDVSRIQRKHTVRS